MTVGSTEEFLPFYDLLMAEISFRDDLANFMVCILTREHLSPRHVNCPKTRPFFNFEKRKRAKDFLKHVMSNCKNGALESSQNSCESLSTS